MEAGKINITGIFNRTRILKIPHFQRSYVWNEEQWSRFFDDMIYAARSSSPYFMGSIILKQQETTTNRQLGDVRTVIDGQQRLTTILLFFKALFVKNEKPEEFFNIFQTLNSELILEHNYSDKPIFDKILLDKELTENDKSKKIYKCYKYFLKRIDRNEIDQNRLLGNVLFVGIDIQGEEDEQQIFDTINSLGVSLTTAELLKNYLFKDDVDSYNRNWRDVFEKDDETRDYWEQKITSGRNIRNNIDVFLQSYLFIKIQDKSIKVNSEDKERFFRIDSIFNSYKEFIGKYGLDKDAVVDELKKYAAIYKETINPKIIGQDIDKDNSNQRLNLVIFGLDVVTIIPYVLYIAKEVPNDIKNKIYRYLEAYLMRRIVCRNTTKNYNQLFRGSLVNSEINTLDRLKELIDKKEDKVNCMPDDNEVKRGFNESWLTNKQAKGVLYLIEKTIRSDMNSTELRFFNEYSLEHVLPKKWRNYWKAEDFSEEQKKERDRILLTLGNLTIITKNLNSSIRDSAWDMKKVGNRKNKGLNEYTRGIETFQSYLQNDVWNESVINERAKELCSYAVNSVWNLTF